MHRFYQTYIFYIQPYALRILLLIDYLFYILLKYNSLATLYIKEIIHKSLNCTSEPLIDGYSDFIFQSNTIFESQFVTDAIER